MKVSSKKFPIGISDFKIIIEDDYYYIDKTLLIKEIIESTGQVILLPRPRRFGKTLNLSMIKYFFEKKEINNKHLFLKTNIWKEKEYQALHGKYPIIFLTFKDIKETCWENAYKKIIAIISEEFERYYLLFRKDLLPHVLDEFESILRKTADEVTFSRSLFLLSKLLYKLYNTRVIILIDEYDAPIHAGYNYGYYNEIVQFMRSLLTSILKDNLYLEKGILTGILRTSKEGIFSGLNNLAVYTLMDTDFQDKFGFTKQEVEKLLKDSNLIDKFNEIQKWYNGYQFGNTTIYNPWSLLMCTKNQGVLKPYWVNTSDNQLIKKLLTLSGKEIKSDFELLLTNKTIEKEVDEAIIFPGIENNPRAIWSLLLFAGYLTYTQFRIEQGHSYCNLTIPNKEIELLYSSFIKDIFESTLTNPKVNILLTSLTTGQIDIFSELLQEFIINTISIYDLPNNEPEKSYHLFVLGLLVLLSDTYQVKSNRESGLGRYDIMLIPKNKKDLGIIIEFKKVSSSDKSLEKSAKKALDQIVEKNYAQELKDLDIKHIKFLGIAFQGKKILVKSKDLLN